MEATAPNTQARNDLFQRLKPCCVKISQLAIREPDAPAANRQLLDLTNQVLDILDDQIRSNPAALDDKLAEYVFFPLYNIFRQMDKYPMSLIENCVRCLTILVVHGWKSKVSAKLAQQILSLLTFIIDGVPGSKEKRELPEETILESFRSLTAVFNSANSSIAAAAGLADAEALPALGHCVTVILDGIAEGANPAIQREAIRTLRTVFAAVREHEALASFLPGTLSSLTKVLSKPASYKNAVLTASLNAVQDVLTRTLGDIHTRSILAKAEASKRDEEAESSKQSTKSDETLGPAWLTATTTQVKKAISPMMKLRHHGTPDVRKALESLCVSLLDECHATLSDCKELLVETAMILDSGHAETSLTETSLRDLVGTYPELSDAIKTAVYQWTSSLPRLMLSGDEDVKQNALRNLASGIRLMQGLHIESSTLEDILSSNLRESVATLVRSSKPGVGGLAGQALMLEYGGESNALVEHDFQPVLISHQSQKELRDEMMALIGILGTTQQGSAIATSLLEYAQASNSDNRIAAIWLCFQLIRGAQESNADVDSFLDLAAFSSNSGDTDAVFDGLYSFAVQLLDSHTDLDVVDWRLEAIALEITAYAARRMGESFRPELIDVLFPIATFLGSDDPNLQQHAIVALNSIAVSCQYSSVTELIIDNVDYMINSVALRLNTLDISPASTKVLIMMIRLAGPRIIPFLDDVVESIFVALDNYHGYPVFVESLFAVLKEAVQQGVRSDRLLLEGRQTSEADHKKRPTPVGGVSSLLRLLDDRAERKKQDKREEADEEIIRSHPKTPWGAKPSSAEGDEGEGEDDAPSAPPETEKPPPSPTYQLVLRISNLTQHYLTSPTPKLRRSLLELLSTASTALAADEDAFLPLVNAIWPVVFERLRDPETFIVVEACATLAGLCEASGDFLSSRFKTEWWDGLGDWCRKMKRQAAGRSTHSKGYSEATIGSGDTAAQNILIPVRSKNGNVDARALSVGPQTYSSGDLGEHASPARIWTAAIKLLTAMVSYVAVDDGMFDEILDLLSDAMEQSRQVREALEVVNADAVWLVRYERGLVPKLATPQVDGVALISM